MKKFIPEHLQKYSRPSNYAGATWFNYYSFLGQSRDSSALERSNFAAGLKAIGGEKSADDDEETPLVCVVRENHWAVGWVEWIAIHETEATQLEIADKIKGDLEDYPVVDENLFSEYEQQEADETWKNCFNPKGRIEYVRQHRSQFEFRDMADLFGCIRGKYFAGYASELIS